jgi:hypothetical protein
LHGEFPLATHYQALGVSPDAEAEVIQGAWRALMRKYHPDANGGAYSDARAKRINAAYAVLSDPAARAAYDAELRAAHRPPPQPEAAEPRGPAPGRPFNEFTEPPPAPETRRRASRLGWRFTAVVTVALAAAGFATGRALTSAPSHAVAEAATPQPAAQPEPSPAPPKAVRAASADGAIAAIVSNTIVPRWRADCSADAQDVAVDLQVTLTRNGTVAGTRFIGGGGDPAKLAGATERARLAVELAAPFDLPPESYRQWRTFIVRFDTKDVCAARAQGTAQGNAQGSAAG